MVINKCHISNNSIIMIFVDSQIKVVCNYNPGQNTSGHLSNFGRKVENLLYMLPSLYEQRLFFFRCFFCAPLPPIQCWNMPAIDERILILETVKNQHCNGGRGKSTNCPHSFDQDCSMYCMTCTHSHTKSCATTCTLCNEYHLLL